MTGAWAGAYEARGQGLAFGLFALALYGWLEAAAGRQVRGHLIVVALAIAAGLWTHYYFVLAYLPILAGEATRQLLQRRVDRGPWLALVASGVLAWPLLLLARTAVMQRETFWTRPSQLEFGAAYHDVLDRLASANPGFAAGILLLIALAVFARRVSLRRWPSGPPAHEVVCGAICLALPAFGVVIGGVIGVFNGRYVTFTAAGFAMTIPLVLWWLTTPRRVAEVVACLTVLYSFGHITRARRPGSAENASTAGGTSCPGRRARPPGPLVLNGGVDYLSLWDYAPPDVQPRLLYLADPSGELRKPTRTPLTSGILRWRAGRQSPRCR